MSKCDEPVVDSAILAQTRRMSRVVFAQEAGMKRSVIAMTVMLSGAVVFAQRGAPSPEMQAALAKQDALEKSTPRLQVAEEVLPLGVPSHTIGEAVGVAKNSKGHLFRVHAQRQRGSGKGRDRVAALRVRPRAEVRESSGDPTITPRRLRTRSASTSTTTCG